MAGEQSRAGDRYAPINGLVERIRRETGHRVPDVEQDGPGLEARVLLVLIAPSDPGALATRELSLRNPDATARNQSKLLAEAHLDRGICLWWNAVPWDVGDRPRPNAADIKAGAPYLAELVLMLRDIRALVAMGKIAQKGCRLANVDAIPAPNPSPLGLYGGGADRWDECRAALVEAARRARSG